MSRLIEFRPGVFARPGELYWSDGEGYPEAWELAADGTWRSCRLGCEHCNPPPEIRAPPTTNTNRPSPPSMGWDWKD